MCVCVCVCVCESVIYVWLFAMPWTVDHQDFLSMEFSRQEYWCGLLCPSPGDLPNLGIKPGLLHCRKILYHLSHQGRISKRSYQDWGRESFLEEDHFSWDVRVDYKITSENRDESRSSMWETADGMDHEIFLECSWQEKCDSSKRRLRGKRRFSEEHPVGFGC